VGHFNGGNARFNRLWLGGEWLRNRGNAWATVSNNKLADNNAGAQVGWSTWLDDHWR